MVLDHITCAGDPGVYDVPLPDANTWGKCWDFNGFRKEFDKIALRDVNPLEMLKPPGVNLVWASSLMKNEVNRISDWLIFEVKNGMDASFHMEQIAPPHSCWTQGDFCECCGLTGR
ncbi:hypothetical protein ColLi_11305 [Colletotrichum liriopes]|uniref:Uncharacterized protein n=1 Tax=Colletotrichum liriopes TaxID=708192 RepID=A0AA37LXM7_9PEZI|nr:hypothetical protein ColLi_11305 [Colletotrichum liriopes]